MTPRKIYLDRILSRDQRDFLIAHIDNSVPVTHHGTVERTRIGLIKKQLIEYDDNAGRPRATRITDLGRQTLCAALGDWADAIERTQRLIDARVHELLAKATRLRRAEHDKIESEAGP